MAIDSFEGEYRFLSNFFPCRGICYDDITYPTVEHAYQAAKTNDFRTRMIIRSAATPGVAKRLGSKVELRSDWEEIKIKVMKESLEQKFVPHGVLAAMLNNTGNHILVEGNTWGDTFWGKVDGEGRNVLGKLLMFIRKQNRKFYESNSPKKH